MPLLVVGVLVASLQVQAAPRPPAHPAQNAKPPVEKLGPDLFRIGTIRVDTAKREISVPGRVNEVTVLEFVANTKGGMKAYESALTLDTDAINFNLALVLIGLDKANAKVPARHFDPATPVGDPVEVLVEVLRPARGGPKGERVRAEALLFDKSSNKTVPEGGWVYTGSTFAENGRYMAEIDGVLIGFVHSPSPVIEYAPGAGIGSYGSIVLNPNLELSAGAPVTLIVRALGAARQGGNRD